MICHSGLVIGVLSVASNKKKKQKQTNKCHLEELSSGLGSTAQQVGASTGLSPITKTAATAPGITSPLKTERNGKRICWPYLLF